MASCGTINIQLVKMYETATNWIYDKYENLCNNGTNITRLIYV